jgi:hypothetical protein
MMQPEKDTQEESFPELAVESKEEQAQLEQQLAQVDNDATAFFDDDDTFDLVDHTTTTSPNAAAFQTGNHTLYTQLPPVAVAQVPTFPPPPPPPIRTASAAMSYRSSAPSSALSTPVKGKGYKPGGNTTIEAGRKKLEEFKRKKMAALTKKAAAAGSGSGNNTTTTTATNNNNNGDTEILVLQGRLAAAEERTKYSQQEAAEASRKASQLDADLQSILRQLENVDAERTALQRDKAAMVGEAVMLKSEVEMALQRCSEMEVALGATEEDKVRLQYLLEQANNSNSNVSGQEESGDDDNSAALQAEVGRLQAQLADKDVQVAQLTYTLEQQEQQLDASTTTAQQQQQQLLLQLEQQGLEMEQLKDDLQSAHDDVTEIRDSLREAEVERQSAEATTAGLSAQLAAAHARIAELEQAAVVQDGYSNSNAGNNDATALVEKEEVVKRQADEITLLQTQLNEALDEARRVSELAAEDVSAARNDLAAILHEAASSKAEAQRLQEEVELLTRHLESSSGGGGGSRWGGGGGGGRSTDDVGTLKLRVEKAEIAVEKERRMVSNLQKQIKEQHNAAEEGRRAVEAALELRRRCEDLERQVVQMQQQQQQQQQQIYGPSSNSGGGGGVEGYQQQQEQEQGEVSLMEAQMASAAASTIEKLLEENNSLTDRINSQAGELERLKDAMAAANRFATEADLALAASTPTSATQGSLGGAGGGGKGGGLERQISWSLPGGVKLPLESLGSGAPTPLASGEDVGQEMYAPLPLGREMQAPVLVYSGGSGSGMVEQGGWKKTTTTTTPKKKKQGGYSFWQWVAGADVADEEE